MEREETILEKHGLIILLVAVYVCCLFFLASQLIQLTGHDYGLALTRLLDTHFTMISHGRWNGGWQQRQTIQPLTRVTKE